MSAFSIFSGLIGDAGKTQTAEETIDKLCDRIVNASLLEDRRAAVKGLKALSREYQLQVGTKGMAILLHILHQDRVDPEVARAVLETLINLCDANTNPNVFRMKSQVLLEETLNENLGIQFTEIFIKDPSNVSLLLSLLAETDFNVRFNDIDLIKILLKNKRKSLQDAILTSPMGVSRLMDLLDDGREVIRNEGLLLLIDLTHNNADIQKIIAFENAFERLFQIVDEEHACDGDVIVQDCLQLVQNLLSDNVSNQNYFRESGLIPRLKPFFKIPDTETVSGNRPVFRTHIDSEAYLMSPWTQQKMKNISLALNVIKMMITSNNPNTALNQKAMHLSGLLNTVLQLGILRDAPPPVQGEALNTASYIAKGNQDVGKLLRDSIVEDTQASKNPRSLIEHLIIIMVSGSSFEVIVRAGTYSIIRSYLRDDIPLQKALLATVAPPPSANPNDEVTIPQSPGSLLFTALLDWDSARKDPWRSWFSASILGLVVSSPHCKDTALKVLVPDADGDMVSFLEAVCHALTVAVRVEADLRVIIGFYTLLCFFLHGSQKATAAYLSDATNFSFLIEQISQVSGNYTSQGLAAYLLGTVFEYNDDSFQSLSRSGLQSIVINRVGADQYVSRLTKLKDSREVQEAGSLESPLTTEFVDLFKATYELMQKSVVNPKILKEKEQEKEESKMQENIIASYKGVISDQDKELAKWKQRVKELEAQLSQKPGAVPVQPPSNKDGEKDKRIGELQQAVAFLESQMQDLKLQVEKAQKDRDDALVFLAEQDAEISHYKSRLRELGDPVDDDEEDGEED